MTSKTLALILAGGQGTRLGKLTQNVAKPAVPFGGRYRIIDFTLSNCTNSNIENVGVITQYQPLALNSHVGNGAPWGLDQINNGVTILQPYSANEGNRWFEGTAHAIYQNIDYINKIEADYVLILSGDHIYKMDYQEMLDAHITKKADLTISVMEVPEDEACRFGIMSTDENERIIEFEEKPENPKSNLASMGIYIFTWKRLKEVLVNGITNNLDMSDFGHHVIPAFIESGDSVFAYCFNGYWKDVGTIDSLFEANMAMLDPENELNIRDKSWQIYSKNNISAPHFITENATVKNSLIGDACFINAKVTNSVFSQNITVQQQSEINNSVIMSGVKIGENVEINYAIIGENAIIGNNAQIIGTPENIAVVGHFETVGEERNEP